MLKEFCIWLDTFILLGFTARYVYVIKTNRDVNPTLSTWIIFLLGTSLSLTTYLLAEHHDFRSGILNTADVISVIITLCSILIWGNRTIRLHAFEKWYLAGATSIVIYGLCTGNAYHSNLFTQLLITFGYAPTVQKMFKEKRNTESFSAWSFSLLAGCIGLIPALIDGNTLAFIYACRSVICVSSFMLLMWHFHKSSSTNHPR